MIKKLCLFCLIILCTNISKATTIEGVWYGTLDIDGNFLEIIFEIKATNKEFTATLSVPIQRAEGIPMTKVTFQHPHLSMSLDNPVIIVEGDLMNQEIVGTFKQGGRSLPMKLQKDKVTTPKVKRPQEPKAPFPYYMEEVSFLSKEEGIKLSGTLTMPKKEGKFPAIILISGSGPQNRDEEIMGHKPFFVLADYFTRKGYAVLRFDDRGNGKSEGDFNKASTKEFAKDVEGGFWYLERRKEILKEKIGLMGHSEGGIIAPMVAAKNESVKFIVLLAGSGIRGDLLLYSQQAAIGKAQGMKEEEIKKSKKINQEIFQIVIETVDSIEMKRKIANYLSTVYDSLSEEERPQGIKKMDFIQIQVHQITSPWMKYFLSYDPAMTLKKVRCPLFAVNGEKDLQVPAEENLKAIQKAIINGGNTKGSVKSYPGLNHLFQHSETGSPEEYGKIEETFAPEVMEDIKVWLDGVVSK